jgi:transcriptional regulator with XRE-family HTH domain
MENQTFTDNVLLLAGPKGWGWIRKFALKVGLSEENARSILSKGVFPKPETLVKIATAYDTTVDALLTDPAEIKKAKEARSSILDNDPELMKMLEHPDFKRNFDKTIKILKDINKLDDDEAAGEMVAMLKHMYNSAKKRKKKNG